jgi:DNA polymerase-1
MTRTLLIDADIVAYRSSAGTQRTYQWEPGVKSVAADLDDATKEAERAINGLIERLEPDNVIVCLSDDFSSFRKDRIDPTYKSVRSTTERPVHLYDVKDWLRSQYDTEERTALEADDVMGILATDPNRTDERIIVSADKDMLTIPGLLFRPQEGKLRTVTPEAADRYHLYQTLIGDTTDGYPGLPGTGPAAAERILAGALWSQVRRTLRSGPRKGVEIEEWVSGEHDGPAWERVVAAYQRGGLTERHALTQARLARILRWTDYDGRSPIMWTPAL